MFTTWEQVSDWIKDNHFAHWVFYKNNPESRDADKANDKIIDSNAFALDDEEGKLQMTEKYLRMYGGRVWGVGFRTANTTVGGTVCEARIEPTLSANGVGAIQQQPQQNIGELRAELTKSISAQLKAEMAKERYEEERKNFEKEKAAFRKEQESVIGLLVHKVAPFAIAALSNKNLANSLQNVAGVDAEGPVDAQPIHPIQDSEADAAEQPEEECPFTDEESDELFELMARFKKAEPDYLPMIRKVVEMAESGSMEYQMASKFLKG